MKKSSDLFRTDFIDTAQEQHVIKQAERVPTKCCVGSKKKIRKMGKKMLVHNFLTRYLCLALDIINSNVFLYFMNTLHLSVLTYVLHSQTHGVAFCDLFPVLQFRWSFN